MVKFDYEVENVIIPSFLFRNLTADLSSCAKESGARQTTILLIIRIRWAAGKLMFARLSPSYLIICRVYVFWCRQWLLLIELKITVITSSFGLPGPPSPSPAPSTTAQPSSPVRAHHLYLSEKKKLRGVPQGFSASYVVSVLGAFVP